MERLLGWRDRLRNASQLLRGARITLFGQGDDAVVCSFCGKDRHETGCDIVAAPGVAICESCASLAVGYAHSQKLGAVPEGRIGDVVAMFDCPATLLPPHRVSLNGDLARCANELSCELVSWGYFCGEGRVGDGLSVHIHAPAGANLPLLRESFRRLYFGSALD
jgi:hypothetical protein